MFERIVITRKQTEFEGLLAQHYSREQASFYLQTRGESIGEYEAAHEKYRLSLATALRALPQDLPRHVIERADIPGFLFRETDLVLALGPDGLVANLAKYLPSQPILGINPDPTRIDGKLVRWNSDALAGRLPQILKGEFTADQITLAEAVANDGQRLLAVNDFLIGRRDQVSARYTITHQRMTERQSSSGVLVATGLGSTGWLSSILNGASQLMCSRTTGPKLDGAKVPFSWDARYLLFVVREPFLSKATGIDRCFGRIENGSALTVVSEMASGGVVFSDGVAEDAIEFNAGCLVTIRPARQIARLITP